jgi:hypothetical protein
MKTIDDIVAAAAKLDPAAFVKLRHKLDHLEEKVWKTELAATTAKMKKAKINDEEIDRRVMKRRLARRRHESRR